MIGIEVTAGIMTAGPMVASGYCSFLAVALALGGIIKLIVTQLKRKSFQYNFSAAFFMKLKL